MKPQDSTAERENKLKYCIRGAHFISVTSVNAALTQELGRLCKDWLTMQTNRQVFHSKLINQKAKRKEKVKCYQISPDE